MAIISITAPIGSGKDLTGRIIQYLTAGDTGSDCYRRLLNNEEITGHHNSEWQIKKWADPLRKVAAILLGVDLQFTYTDEFKQMVLPECWGYWYVKCDLAKHPIDSSTMRVSRTYNSEQEAKNEWFNGKDTDLGFEITSTVPTGRWFLQNLGTEAIRNGLHPNAWVNALMSEYKGWTEKYWTPADGYGEGYLHRACKECNNSFTGWKRQVRCQDCNEKSPTVYPNWIITDTRFTNELYKVKDMCGITVRINRPQEGSSEGLHSSETALDNAEFDYVINNTGTIEDLIEEVRKFLKHYNII